MENAKTLGITIFHSAITDVFVANCKILFDDLIGRHEQEQQDFWVKAHFIYLR